MTRKELEKLICDIFNIEKITPMISNQIHKYITMHEYTYLDIARALSFYVDVKGRKAELKYGIGIVPLVKEEAILYFKKLKEKIEAKKELASKIKDNKQETIYVKNIKSKKKEKDKIDIEKLFQ